MSKGTSGGSRWSGWPWGRTPGGTEPFPTANRTALYRAVRLVGWTAAALVWCGCARDATRREYDRLEAEFRRGDLVQVAASAQQRASKLADQPRRQWEYRLLAAESLTLLSRYAEAGKLLAEDPPENLA